MIIIGAKGHAIELLDVLEKNNFEEEIFFYDDITDNLPDKLYNKYPIFRSAEEMSRLNTRHFALGIGIPMARKKLSNKFKLLGWELISVISKDSIIGNYNVLLEPGLNIMHNVFISNDVRIGEGTLINNGANIHHNVEIGNYCEISPKVYITGNVTIGDFTTIGTGAIIIPKVNIGKNCIIGAGSVVNKDIPDNSIAVGTPAKVIKEVEPFNG